MVMAGGVLAMAWLRVVLTEEQQRVVNEERDSHPQGHVRRKMLVLWLLHCGLTREKAAEVACLGRATVQRYVAAFREGGLDGLRRCGIKGPVSDLAAHREAIREEFTRQSARSIAEACERIEKLTGIRRQPSQVRKFLKDMGLSFQRVRAIPVPPKKTLEEHVQGQKGFLEAEMNPRLEEAREGKRHLFFVDAAHMVFGTFLCCLWSFARQFVRAASGRQRFNVLGAWNAITRELVSVTNTTVVNTETMCELLRKLAAQGLVGPITLVLDNAKYQRNEAVKALAKSLSIELLFLPSYSPNLNLIERLWRFTKREALYGRYHATFADFQSAILDVLGKVSTQHKDKLASLMTLNFQVFENVSLMAA
jgi:transposase